MNFSHLLVLKPSSLGDIVHTLPAVAALRAQHPDARITWMVNSEWAPLLQGNPHVTDTLVFPRQEFRGPRGFVRFLRWRAGLRDRLQPDAIADFQGLLRTGLVARAFRGVPVYGLSDAREGAHFFHSHTVGAGPGMHAVERYLALAAALGAGPATPPRFDLPAGTPPPAALPAEPFVVLHPFSRGEGKSLSADATDAFCRALGLPVVIVGRAGVRLPPQQNALDLLNRTSLAELIWLLRRASFVVSVDSGPMHLAAAVTDRLLGVHAWSDPCRVGPYRPGAHVWRGGQFFDALDPASSRAPATLPDPHEAAAMAEWVRGRVGRND